jgi:dynein heavy chain, axonemal
MNYPFNTGDLLCCGQTAHNYLESNVKVPWDDLVYIFGEIMYGGHIVEDWDRRLANAYLFKYFNESLLEGAEFFSGFGGPPTSLNHKQAGEFLLDMPGETPIAFGFHPNAEIGFKLREGDAFCNALILMQPRDAGGEGGMSEEERARATLEDIVERLPETYDMEDIRGCEAVACCKPLLKWSTCPERRIDAARRRCRITFLWLTSRARAGEWRT